MDLKQENEIYQKSKQKLKGLDKAKEKIEELKKEVVALTRKVEDLDVAKTRAEEDGDKEAVKKIEEESKTYLEKLNKSKKSFLKLKEQISAAEVAVTSQIDKIKEDPELKDHINKVIALKFSRQISAKQKEKENLLSQNLQLEMIKAAAEKDPYVMNTLKGIEGYTKKIEELEKKTLGDTGVLYMTQQDKVDVQIAQSKIEMRRQDLATYFKGKQINISDEVIKSITSYSNISKTMRSNIRQAKGIDKQIANYETALENIGLSSVKSAPAPEKTGSTIKSQILGDVPLESTSGETKTSKWEDERNNGNLPDVQPKWYQFVKRFRNWMNQRSARRDFESKPEEKASTPLDTSTLEKDVKKSKFKYAMQYDVVKDYEAQLEKDLLKQAKEQRKLNDKVENKEDEQSR